MIAWLKKHSWRLQGALETKCHSADPLGKADLLREDTGSQVRLELEALGASVIKGLHEGGIRKILKPSQLMKMEDVLRSGSAEDVSFLMLDVAGEAVSLGVGQSTTGAQAIQALSLIQAGHFVDRRDKSLLSKAKGSGQSVSGAGDQKLSVNRLAELVREHQSALIAWVSMGAMQINGQTLREGLTEISREFLVEVETRKSAAAIFIAASSVLIAGLTLWSGNSNSKADASGAES